MINIGAKIKQARENKRLSQAELANLIGVKKGSSISEWENDKHKPDIDTVELLCGVLEITPSWLFSDESSENSLTQPEAELLNSFRTLDATDKEYFSEIIQLRSEATSKHNQKRARKIR